MSNTLTIWSGVAPQGSVRTEWDWNEDEDGYRYKSYYDLVPMELVHTVDEINLNDQVRDITYRQAQDVAAQWIEAMVAEGGIPADMELVIQFTIGDGTGMNFKASGWGTVSMALDFLAL